MRKYNEEKFEKKLETLSIEELNNFILLRYWEEDEEIDDKIIEYLKIRHWKLNKTFEWTAENKEQFLRLNEKYISCWEKLCADARSLVKNLQKRKNENDGFLHDFEIEAKIKSYIYVPDENGEMCPVQDCIEEIVIRALNEDCFFPFVNYQTIQSENDLDNYFRYLDPEHNRNDYHLFREHFGNDFISQSMYDLVALSCLSLYDVLKINHLQAELRVVHQHFVDL